jgi:hypothetical protein
MSSDPRTALEAARSAAGLDRPDRPLTAEESLALAAGRPVEDESPERIGQLVADAERERQRRLADHSGLTPEAQLRADT